MTDGTRIGNRTEYIISQGKEEKGTKELEKEESRDTATNVANGATEPRTAIRWWMKLETEKQRVRNTRRMK